MNSLQLHLPQQLEEEVQELEHDVSELNKQQASTPFPRNTIKDSFMMRRLKENHPEKRAGATNFISSTQLIACIHPQSQCPPLLSRNNSERKAAAYSMYMFIAFEAKELFCRVGGSLFCALHALSS